MEAVPLVASVGKVLEQVLMKSEVVSEGQIFINKLRRPRMRAQAIVEAPPAIAIQETEGSMTAVTDKEVQHCAAVIAAAFLNPTSANWDYDRFVEASETRRKNQKFFEQVHMGEVTKPATVVDKHGKILIWYLPGLLLPHRVEELNNVSKGLKEPLCKSVKSKPEPKAKSKSKPESESKSESESESESKSKSKSKPSWRSQGFTCDGENAIFGIGRLSISIGSFMLAHQRLQDGIYSSPNLRKKPIRRWLQLIGPAEQLWNAVLEVVHPEMWMANKNAIPILLEMMKCPLPTWPTVYPSMDIIANRITPRHYDVGGAATFYDHLVSFGQDHKAKLALHDFHAEFAYGPGTSILFPGKVLAHSVSEWADGKERLVVAHYTKDDVQDRLELARPALPTQLGWWSRYK